MNTKPNIRKACEPCNEISLMFMQEMERQILTTGLLFFSAGGSSPPALTAAALQPLAMHRTRISFVNGQEGLRKNGGENGCTPEVANPTLRLLPPPASDPLVFAGRQTCRAFLCPPTDSCFSLRCREASFVLQGIALPAPRMSHRRSAATTAVTPMKYVRRSYQSNVPAKRPCGQKYCETSVAHDASSTNEPVITAEAQISRTSGNPASPLY